MIRSRHFDSLLNSTRLWFGTTGGDQDITSRVEPWDEAKPYFQDLYIAAQQSFINTPRDVYSGTFFAGENDYDLLARTALDEAANEMSLDADRIRDHQAQLYSGYWLNPNTNPFILGTVNASLDTVNRQFTDEILPSIIDHAIQGGAYSGTSQAELTLRAIERYSNEANKISAAVYYENYQRERTILEASPQLLTVAENIEAKKGQLLQANADLLRALTQIGLDEALKHREQELLSPWYGFVEYTSVLTGGGFSSQSQEQPQANPLGSLLTGAIGGAATGWAIGSEVGAVGGPAGAVIGGLLGGIGGLM